MTLHILSRAPFDGVTLGRCLDRIRPGDTLVLIEDAVYAVEPPAPPARLLENSVAGLAVYALEADLLARGISGDEIAGAVRVLDYDGLVDLAVANPRILSWY